MTAVLPFFVTFASGMPSLGMMTLVLQEFMSWVIFMFLDAVICTGEEDTASCRAFYPLAHPHASMGSSDDLHGAPVTLGAVDVGRWFLTRILVGFLAIMVGWMCEKFAQRMRHGQRMLAFTIPVDKQVHSLSNAELPSRPLLSFIPGHTENGTSDVKASTAIGITPEQAAAFAATRVSPWIDMAHGARGGWIMNWMSCNCLPRMCGGSDEAVQSEPYGLGIPTEIELADRVTWVWMFAWCNVLAALCLLADLAPAYGWIYLGDSPLWIVRVAGVPCLFTLCVGCMHLVMYLWIFPGHEQRKAREANATAYAWRVTTLAREYFTLFLLGPGAISLYISLTAAVLTPWIFSTSVLGDINYATSMATWRDAHIAAEFIEFGVSLGALLIVWLYAYMVYWIKTTRYDREQMDILQKIANDSVILRMD